MSRSISFIYQTLKLATAPKPALDALDRGEISVKTVVRIARIPNRELADKAAHQIIRENYTGAPLSDSLAQAHIERHYMRELKGAPFDPNSTKLVAKAGSCETCGRPLDFDRSTGDPDAIPTIQHVDGSSNDPSNLKAFCRRCNMADNTAGMRD